MTARDVVVAFCLGSRTTGLEADLRYVQRFSPRARIVTVADASAAFALSETADVVLVRAGIQVGPGWLERLLRVVDTHPGVGTVSALSTADTQGWGIPSWPAHLTWPEVARAVAIAELPWSVPLTAPRGPCVLVTRDQIRSGDSEEGTHFLAPRVFVALDSTAAGNGVPAAFDQVLASDVRGRLLLPELRRVWAQLASAIAVPPRRLYVSSSPTAESGRRRPLNQHAYERTSLEVIGLEPDVLLEEGIELIHVDDLCEALAPSLASLARTVGAGLVIDAEALTDGTAHPGVDAVIVHDESAARAWRAKVSGTDCLLATAGVGSDLAGRQALRLHEPRKPGPFRAVLVDPIASASGEEFLSVLIEAAGSAVEWHVVGGDIASAGSGLVSSPVRHGKVSALLRRVVLEEIDPDVWVIAQGLVQEVALQEQQAQGLGVPVIVGRSDHAGAEVLRLAASPTLLRSQRRKIPRHRMVPVAAAAERHRELYEAVEGRRHLVNHRIGYVTLGEPGNFGGCQEVRVLRPLANQAVNSTFSVRQIFVPELFGDELGHLDTLLVQRQVLRKDTEDVIAAVRAAGVRLVVELDDDLLHPEAAIRMGLGAHAHGEVRDRMITLLRAADSVMVSTTQLQRRVAEHTRAPCTVVPNALDPRLWFREVHPLPAAPGPARILYMGTKTHLEDLMLLRQVVPALSSAIGRPVVLEVVGVSDPFDGDDWFERLTVPPEATTYPEFVGWLRVRQHRWSAAVAPLADTEFNSSKSDLKLLEYAALGLPVVASRAGPYRFSDRLARLVGDEPAEWIAALVACIAPDDLQDRSAAMHVLEHRTLAPRGVEDWLSTIAGEQLLPP